MLRDRLGEIADELAVSDRIRKKILIVADEVFTNIVRYAYSSGGGTVDIFVEYDENTNRLVMTFSDSGVPFNPLEVPEPVLDQSVQERPIGGLGIHLVRQFADTMEYRRENDRNILVLRIHL